MQDLLVRLRPGRRRPGVADSARHAVRGAAAALDLPELLGHEGPVPRACPMTADPPASSDCADPSPALETAFRAVAARMQGLAFVNPALAVEAIGFAPWSGHWLGVLLTPWFMNLVLAPRESGALASTSPPARSAATRFPPATSSSSARATTRSANSRCARCSRRCSSSPTRKRRGWSAQLARDALFDAANAETPAMPRGDRRASRDARGAHAQLQPMSRRDADFCAAASSGTER